ncbi:MAG: shikimate dehydrogenase [Inquilinus sp.]|nr:shikimate dehydrogenase [Inquilinus sp.]
MSGRARLAGVIGWPIGHSRSPLLHGHWLDRYRIDGAYLPLAVPPDRLEAALRGLPALGFRGCNVTVPHKVAVAALVDQLDPVAERIGAVNTVTVAADGSLAGSNTDAFGFVANLDDGAAGWRDGVSTALVIGAGGAARAVLVALLDAGVPAIRIANRTAEKATALAAEFGPDRIAAVPWAERHEAAAGAGLLVNASSLGMTGQPALEFDLAALPAEATVTDLVYDPLRTPLLAAAAARGNRIVDGLGMLLHQARPGFAAWFGVEPTVDAALRRAVLAG